jgi:hypothetical protein
LDKQPLLLGDPSLEDMRARALAWVIGMRKVMRARPSVASSQRWFVTEEGKATSPAYPALYYTRRLAEAVWREGVLHLRRLAPWPDYFPLPDPALLPRLTLKEAVRWCVNTARLLETVICWYRAWLPNAGPGSVGLDQHSLRSAQTRLLAITQALALLDAGAQAAPMDKIWALQQCEQLMATAPVPGMYCISETTTLVRHIWLYQLALHSGSKQRFEVSEWCVRRLDHAKLAGHKVYRSPQFDALLTTLAKLRGADPDKPQLEPLRYPAPERNELEQSYASECFRPPADRGAAAVDRPVPLDTCDTMVLAGVPLPEPSL